MATKNRFRAIILSAVTCLSLCAHSHNMVEKEKMVNDGIVRLSRIEVYPQYLDEYMEFAVEVGTKSPAYRTGSADHVCHAGQREPLHYYDIGNILI